MNMNIQAYTMHPGSMFLGDFYVRNALNAVNFCKKCRDCAECGEKINSTHFTAFLPRIHREILSPHILKFTASTFVAN